MEKGEISRKLAEFAVETKFSDIPTTIIEKTKRHILDTLGAGIAGSLSDEAAKLAAVFKITENSGNVPLWATGHFNSARNAALANGMACHTFELDDTGGCDHSGAVVVPAAFACLRLCNRKVSGKDFITSIVIGYDIARRALEACGAYEPHNEAGWHSTSTCGTFGAAAAVGHLLKLNIEQMQSALGLASSFSGGLWGFIHDGAQNKKLHPGIAADGGLFSALLARENFKGAHMIFDDVWGGFTNTYAPASAIPSAWLNELSINWKIARVSIKPHASCRSTHAAIDAVDILMQDNNINSCDIEKVEVDINPFVNGMCGGRDISTLPQSQMSLPYGIAARLVYGSAGLTSYSENSRRSENIKDTMSKIILKVDDSMASDEEPFVTIITKSGTHIKTRVEVPLGSPTNPISDIALIDKYKNLAKMVWKSETVDKLLQSIMSLEKAEDMLDIEKTLATTPFKKEL